MRRAFAAYTPYGLLTLAVMLPLLSPGYILTLDLVFTPKLRAPDSVSNDWLWHNFLHYLNYVLSGQVIEKLILCSIPLLAGIGMHRLVAQIKPKAEGLDWQWAVYAAGIFYAVNPFTYSRFMAGQYAVLLGYALLPWFTLAFMRFLEQPAPKELVKVLAWALLISIISIHTIGMMSFVALVLMAAALWRSRKDRGMQKRLAGLGATTIAVFAVLSSYWLLPLILGHGDTAQSVQHFGAHDAAAFATVGSSKLTQFFNVLNLQGFWAEGHSLFTLPQEQLTGWGTVRLMVWAMVVWGAVWAWRTRRGLAFSLTAIGIVSAVIATGLPQGLLTAIGYREPQKFAGLLAFVFAIFLAFGAARLTFLARQRSETAATFAASMLLLIVIIFTPTMYWGFGGQLQAADYPADWYKANDWLNRDRSDFVAVALPWHEYMSFGFSGRVTGYPAQDFFDKPVIISHNPELGKLKEPGGDTRRREIAKSLAKHDKDLGRNLAKHHIKYLLLAKDFDYKKYSYLEHQPGFRIVFDSPSMTIYRNLSEGGAK